MLKIRFHNLKRIFNYINKLKTEPVGFPSVFSSIKKMVLFAALIFFVSGVTFFIVVFAFNKNRETVSVPKVINMKFYKAYEVLNSQGINVSLELKYFNNFKKGIVAYQSIEEEETVKKGRKIKLIVSLGPEKSKEEIQKQEYEINRTRIIWRLPKTHDTARVKILITDEKEKDRVVFDQIISRTNKINFPADIHGQGIKKIYIDDELFIEQDIEY